MVEAKRKFRLINYDARQVPVAEFREFHRAGVPSPAAGMQRPEIHLGRLAPVQPIKSEPELLQVAMLPCRAPHAGGGAAGRGGNTRTIRRVAAHCVTRAVNQSAAHSPAHQITVPGKPDYHVEQMSTADLHLRWRGFARIAMGLMGCPATSGTDPLLNVSPFD